jgi:hypothetical protein
MPEIARESDLLRMLVESLRARLPRGWKVSVRPSPAIGNRRPDGLLEVASPNGERAVVLLEAKLGLEPRQVEPLVRMLEEALVDVDVPATDKGPPLVVARFISPRARSLLEERDASYADATGNIRLALERPAVFIQSIGAATNPWREVRDLRSLKGRSAARVVRALCDLRPPFGVRDLVERAGASAGSTVRVLEFLEREALIVRDERKQVTEVLVSDLIQRWATDFRFSEQNAVRAAFEPRRLDDVLERLRGTERRYAVTGSFAAARVAPYAESRLLAVYADEADDLIAELGLRVGMSQSNVWVAEPPDDLPFVRTWDRDGLRYSALSQVACDLVDMPGRSPSEAEELLSWMEANRDAGRTD